MAVLEQLPLTGTLYADDIRDTLNANGSNVDDNLLTLFKPSAGINMWAKHKPEKHPAAIEMTAEQRRTNKYGLTVYGNRLAMNDTSVGDTPDDVYSRWRLGQAAGGVITLGSAVGVKYTLPKGGQSSPYRLADFRGYYPSAVPPVTTTFNEDVVLGTSDYQLNSIEASDLDSTAQIVVGDIYQSDTPLRRGLYVASGNITGYCIGKLPLSDLRWKSLLAGTDDAPKEVRTMEFLTDYPDDFARINNISSTVIDWTQYKIWLLPYPYVRIYVKKSTASDTPTPAEQLQFRQHPVFTTTAYDNVKCTFRMTPATSGILKIDISVRLHKVAADGSMDTSANGIISYKTFKDVPITDGYTPYLNVLLSNTSGSSNVYFAIVWNSVVQYKTLVFMESTLD
jgi:hypothetical protein